MAVEKTDSRRTVAVEVEVPGTPEQVWDTIATGPGISAWFVPTDVEPREGGAIAFHMDPGVDAPAIVTGWDPPRRFAYEERGWAANAPPLATEITVHARGGVCTVRLVHSLFTSSDAWDDQLESFETGWPGLFQVLRLYLRDFAGQPCATIRVTSPAAASETEAWQSLRVALGIDGGSRHLRPGAGAPPLAGTIQDSAIVTPHVVLARLERPAPGVGLFGIYSWNDRIIMSMTLYLYGEGTGRIAARDEAGWRAWASSLAFA